MKPHNQATEDSLQHCRDAVRGAYKRLRELGETEVTAFRAALTVHALWRPGQSTLQRIDQVDEWLETESEPYSFSTGHHQPTSGSRPSFSG